MTRSDTPTPEVSKVKSLLLFLVGLGVTFGVVVAAPTTSCAQSPEELRSINAVLAQYELVRAALARDEGSAVRDPSRAIVQRISATRWVAADLAARMAEASRAADRLSSRETTDLPALRRAFGDLSRTLITLREEHPRIAPRLHVFECPMADGYGRWLQPSTELQNPYMGQRMLACGRRVP